MACILALSAACLVLLIAVFCSMALAAWCTRRVVKRPRGLAGRTRTQSRGERVRAQRREGVVSAGPGTPARRRRGGRHRRARRARTTSGERRSAVGAARVDAPGAARAAEKRSLVDFYYATRGTPSSTVVTVPEIVFVLYI